MKQAIFFEIKKIVQSACLSSYNKFGYGIWTHHILPVVDLSKKLAPKFNADTEIVAIAALLHDYAGIKDYSIHKEHHIYGSVEAGKILKSFNYPDDKIQKVKHCIENHRGSVNSKKRSAEAECLASADAIAHIQNAASLLFLVYRKFEMDIDEGAIWVRNKIERSWNKIDERIRSDYLVDYRAAIHFLKNH